MKSNKVRQVWREFDFHTAKQNSSHDPSIIDQKLEAIFCPGPFYSYIFDFGSYSFVTVSNSYKTLIGLEPSTLSIDDLIGRVHPDEIAYFAKCESTVAEFLFGFLQPEQMLNYKVSYCFRMLTADGTYKLFLHQAMAISLDEKGRLGRVIGVHSDISHLSSTNNYRLSLFGMNGEPSYTNIDVDSENATNFKPNKLSLTKREVKSSDYWPRVQRPKKSPKAYF